MATTAATLCFIVGLAAITVGVWRIDSSAGLIVGGTIVVVGAWFVRKGFDGPARSSD